MKKVFGLVLALALMVPALASAEIKTYGQFDIMGVTGYNVEGLGAKYTNARSLLGASMDVEKNVVANLALSYRNAWGTDATDGMNLNDVQSAIRIAEANVVFNNLFGSKRFSAQIGKFFYGDEDSNVFYIGLRNMYGASQYAAGDAGVLGEAGMDGAKVTYKTKKLKVDAVYGMLDTKESVALVDAKYKFNKMFGIQGYLYDSQVNPAGTGSLIAGQTAVVEGFKGADVNRSQIVGLKPTVKFGNISFSAEYAQQFMSDEDKMFDNSYKSYMTKGDVSVLIPIGKTSLLPRAMYAKAGENFNARGNTWLGLNGANSLIELSNIEVGNIGADFAFGKFKLLADLYHFSVAKGNNAKATEFDFIAQYFFTERITFEAGIGSISNDDDDINSNPNPIENATKVILGASYKF